MIRIVLAVAITVLSMDCWAQTIADVARQERERQKQTQSQPKYSNTGIPATVSVTPSSTVVSAPAGAASQSSGVTDSKGRDEKFWRTAFQKARDEAKRTDDKVQVLDLRIKELNSQLLVRSDIYNRENTIGAQLRTAEAELELARKDAEQAKQKLADLEEELRKSGGLAGWAR
jgi:hypothetical protein